jgi:hypothetical protein
LPLIAIDCHRLPLSEIVSANQEDVAAFASAREANQAKEGGDAANNALAERLLLTPKKLGDVASAPSSDCLPHQPKKLGDVASAPWALMAYDGH